MFANMLRADAYRFLRSRFARTIGVVFCLMISLFCLFNFADHSSTSFAFGGSIGVAREGVELIDGFVGFAYTDPGHPLFWELVYSATCFTAATMFAIPITGMMITTADDQNGITKIAVAQGQSQTWLYLSKAPLAALVMVCPILAAVMRAHPSRIVDSLLGLNPVWHLNRVSRAWAQTQIVGHTWLLFAMGCAVLMAASLTWLRRRELS